MHHPDEERYGKKEEQQVCMGCADIRKLWYAPFTPCESGCGRYICEHCYDTNQSEFCYCCHKCGNCATLMLSCANCGRSGCGDAENDQCQMHECKECSEGTCADCENGEECVNCGASIKPLWYVENRDTK